MVEIRFSLSARDSRLPWLRWTASELVRGRGTVSGGTTGKAGIAKSLWETPFQGSS